MWKTSSSTLTAIKNPRALRSSEELNPTDPAGFQLHYSLFQIPSCSFLRDLIPFPPCALSLRGVVGANSSRAAWVALRQWCFVGGPFPMRPEIIQCHLFAILWPENKCHKKNLYPGQELAESSAAVMDHFKPKSWYNLSISVMPSELSFLINIHGCRES